MEVKNCVLGVFETLSGLDIAGEMSCWLKKNYYLYKVCQEPIKDNLYEFPALLFATDFSIHQNEPVLYLHTKGAANPAPIQDIIRQMWKKEFVSNKNWYEDHLLENEPCVVCPFTTNEDVAWYNGFIMNPLAAKIIHDKIKSDDRYYYEKQLLQDTGIKVIGKYEAEKMHVTPKLFETMGLKYQIRIPKEDKK